MLLKDNFVSEQPKFYGRRQGRRIRKAKTTLLDAFLPRLQINDDTVFEKERLFGLPVEQVCLEIGFGNGEHLAGQALKNPHTGFIGAEVFKNGVANLLTLITGIKQASEVPDKIALLPERTDNIRIYDDDMRLLFPRIPDAFLDKVFVLFPDPWPKKRHAGRRFINPDNLAQIARILKKAAFSGWQPITKFTRAGPCDSLMPTKISDGRQPAETIGSASLKAGSKPNTSARPSEKDDVPYFWTLNVFNLAKYRF